MQAGRGSELPPLPIPAGRPSPGAVTMSTAPTTTMAAAQQQPSMREGGTSTAKGAKRDYKGFVAGVFSGIAKLSGKYLPTSR